MVQANAVSQPRGLGVRLKQQSGWQQAGQTTALAADHHALPHSPGSSRTQNRQARLLAHLSTHLLFAAEGQRRRCEGVQELLRHASFRITMDVYA